MATDSTIFNFAANAASQRRSLRSLYLFAALVCLLGPSAASLRSQSYLNNVGVPTFTTKLPVENGFINAANGNLHLEIPLGSWPQRAGREVKASLVYDSAIWQYSQDYWSGYVYGWTPTNIPNQDGTALSMGGWRLVVSSDPGWPDAYQTAEDCYWADQDGNPFDAGTWAYYIGPFVWTAPDGTQHSFPISTYFYSDLSPYCGADAGQSTGDALATDGTGYHMFVTNYSDSVVFGPDGSMLFSAFAPYTTHDTNGNIYTTDGSGNFYDSLGREIVQTTVGSGTITYKILNAQGSYSSYTVTTGTVHANTYFNWGFLLEYSGSFTAVTSVGLPDGSQYSFSYDSGSSGHHYGQLTQMNLPTGNAINYSYTGFTDAYGRPYSVINSRTTPDSSTPWYYGYSVVTTCSSYQTNCGQKATVTKPSGDHTVYTFNLNGGAWTNEVQYYTGSISSADLLATVNQCFNYVTVTSGGCTYSVTSGSPATNIFNLASNTVLPLPGGSTISATTEYTWDSNNYGDLTKTAEWNFGTSTSGNPDRITNISYLNGSSYISAHILNRPSSVTVTNGSGTTTVAQTTYSYDDTSLSSATGMTNHDDTNYPTSNTVRGNLTTVNQYVDGTHYLTTTTAYDMTGQKVSSHDSNSNQTTYSYSDCFKEDNGTNPPSSYSGSATNAYPTSVTLANSLSSSACYYYGTGQLASITDLNSNTTYFHFQDSLNRPTGIQLPSTPLGSSSGNGWTLNAYDQTGSSPATDTGVETYTGITTTSPSTSCSGCRHDETELDTLGRIKKQDLVNDPDGETTVLTTYDVNGRVATASAPFCSSSSSQYPCSASSTCPDTFSYDGLDRKTAVTHVDSTSASIAYGASVGSGVSQGCSTSTYGYGYPTLYTDEAGNKRQTWTDAFGRLIETDEPNSSGSLALHTCHTYDLNNNLTGLLASDGSQTRSYSYDRLLRVTQMTDPESGTTYFCYGTGSSCNGTSGTTKCSGDPNAPCLRTDAKSTTTTYTYDDLNRLIGKSYSDGTPSVTYSYDSTTCLSLSVSCYNLGKQTGMSDASGSASWAYDAVGNFLRESRTIAGVTKTMTYTYNLDTTLATLQYPGSRTVTYTTGNAQRPTAAADTTNSITYATTGQYAPTGALASLSSGSGNILSGLYYNNRTELCRIAVNTSGTAPTSCTDSTHTGNLMDLAFAYVSGNNGNLATETNNLTSGRTQTYTYDPLNRILSAGTPSGSDCWGQTFGNNATPPTLGDDALGNLVAINSTQCSSPSLSLSVNVHNQFSSSGFGYDSSGNGNMTNDAGGNTYAFDAENHVNTATNSAGTVYCYLYDGNGLRVAKGNPQMGYTCLSASPHAPTMYELYWRNIAGNTIAETDGGGSTINSAYNEYVFFAGRRIAQSNPNSGNVNFYFADQLGSTRMVTSSSGTPCYKGDFQPYGTEKTPAGFTNSCSTTYKFTGYERDPETAAGTCGGNDYALARYYDCRLGRFLTPDPMLLGNISDPQSLNRYAYVRNNPVNAIDPHGLDCVYTGQSDGPGGFAAVSVVRGDCISDTDDGIFVDGTIDLNSFGVTYGPNGNTLSYNVDSGAIGTIDIGNFAPMFVQLAVPQMDMLPPPNLGNAMFGSGGWLDQLSILGSALRRNFADEFRQGGCFRQFAAEVAGLGDGGPIELSDDPHVGPAVETATTTGFNMAALLYAGYQGLTVPLRSSTVRGILSAGETAAAKSSAILSLALTDYSESAAVVNEVDALKAGTCH